MLELVATMPSSPFGAEVLLTLDIVSRSIGLITRCPSRSRGWAGDATLLLYAKTQPGARMRSRNRARSGGPNRQRRLAQNLLLEPFFERQRAKVVEILLDFRHARTWPVGSEQSLFYNLVEAGKVLEQALGRDAADVKIDVGMAAD